MQTSENNFLKLNPDTIQYLRKQYNLDSPARLNESIDILEEWLKKQGYTKKNISRDYLERALILAKGSVEKVKRKLETLSTYRALTPKYFEMFDPDICRKSTNMIDSLLPKMTSDHYRVYLHKLVGDKVDDFTNFYKACTAIFEYIHTHDYCNGVVVIIDFTETDILEVLKVVNVMNMQQILKILVDGFGLRLKGLHIVTPSKLINLIVAFFKQAVSEKLKKRIYTHMNYDTLYDFVPRDIFPSDFGGKEKPIKELHDEFINIVSCEKFMEHLAEMSDFCIKTDLRQRDVFGSSVGMSGTFRSLCID